MSRIHSMQGNPILTQLLTRQHIAQGKETGPSPGTAVQSLIQGGPSLSGTGNQASGPLYGTDPTAQAPATQTSPAQSDGQDTVSISTAALQALQGQAPESARTQQTSPTYPNYQINQRA